jgi:hypothetical protein
MQNKKVIIPIFIALIVVSGALIMTQTQPPRDRQTAPTEQPQKLHENAIKPTTIPSPTEPPHNQVGTAYTENYDLGTTYTYDYMVGYLTYDGLTTRYYLDGQNIQGYANYCKEAYKYTDRNVIMTVTYTHQTYQGLNGVVTQTWISDVAIAPTS